MALRNWMTSLGLGRPITSVHEDCRDGVLLLRVAERLRPGCVEWRKVQTRRMSVYKRAENCNYALRVLASCDLGVSVVGISGQDLATGTSAKLTLAVVWQLMRADVMRFLSTLRVDEAQVIGWANAKVAHALGRREGEAALVSSFNDLALRDGVFLLRCLAAVAPECVDFAIVLPGESAEEREENARYVVSCAHKAGCTLFLSWRDVAEVQPRMVLSLLAAIMSLDLKRGSISVV